MASRAATSQCYRRSSHRRLPCCRWLLVVTLCWLLATAGSAQPPPECILSELTVSEDNRGFPAVQRVKEILACMPENNPLGREVHSRFAALNPSHAFETRGELPVNGATTGDLYEALHAISTLKGIRYFSILRRAARVLFKTAHAINNQGIPIADPVPSADSHSITYALVNDASFGKAPYRLEYRAIDNAILLLVSNSLPLSVMRIKLIDSDQLLIALLITPGDASRIGQPTPASNTSFEEWTIHGLVAAQAPRGSFLEGFVEASLRSRLAAMQNWIVDRAASVAPLKSNTG